MDSRKAFLYPVVISIIGHVALISVSSMIDIQNNVKTTEIFTVDIKEPQQTEQPAKKEEKKDVKKQTGDKTPKAINTNGWREEKVDLNTSDVKYAAYLGKIKKRILQIWEYPQKAYEKNEEGIAVVKMSIDANGKLAETNLISSSGSILLDENALGVARAAAPFEPLPTAYNLSRLHIVASFRYKLVD
jgi:periplasmic protein TonB